MILPILLAATLANPFGAFSGTGARGRGERPRPKSVAMYGDSLIQGTCSGTPPPVALDALLPGGTTQGYTVDNKGVSGESAHAISVRVQSGASTACVSTTCGYYVVEGMVNTLLNATFAANTPAEVAAIALHGASSANSGTCDTGTAHACGFMDTVDWLHANKPNARIFAIGVLPYKGCDNITCPSLVDPGERAAAANSGLQTECASRAWLTCILPYDDFEDPDNPDELLPAYACADEIHLVNAGSAALAQHVYDSSTW